MPDHRFFQRLGPMLVADALERTGARSHTPDGQGPTGVIDRVAALDEADLEGALVFAVSSDAASMLAGRNFALCLTTPALGDQFAATGRAVAILDDPKAAFMRLAGDLHSCFAELLGPGAPQRGPGIHPTAVVDATARLGEGVSVGPHAVVGFGVEIGAGTTVGAGSVVSFSVIGGGVVIGAGAVIGAPGFGFIMSADGLIRSPQLGIVEIADRVEIGANCTIDRGAIGATRIGRGSKIDSLCHIGHNVRIGQNTVLAAQCGLSGSVRIGDNVLVGGQVGIADHVSIGDGARIAAQSGLMKDVPDGETWGGYPAKPIRQWMKETALAARAASRRTRANKDDH